MLLLLGVLVLHAASAAAAVLSFNTPGYPLGANPQGFDTGDCDGDGWPDLIAAGQNSNDVVIFRNNGSGSFEFVSSTPVGAGPSGAGCSDFNGDGRVDFAVASRVGTFTVYLQNANGSYTSIGDRPAGVSPRSTVSGDLNNDGRPDLVTVGSTSQDITVLLSTGTAGLPPFSRIRVDLINPQAAAIADFDLDGHPDIAVVGTTEPFVELLFGDGTGFTPQAGNLPTPFVAGPRQPKGAGIAAADVDEDGKPDLAVLSTDSVVRIYHGTGGADFTFLRGYVVTQEVDSLALRDMDGDGLVDLLLGSSDTNAVQVLFAVAPGEFPLSIATQSPLITHSETFNAVGPAAGRTAPGTSDGYEMISVSETTRALTRITQSAQTNVVVTPMAAFADAPQVLALADLTNDGIPDAITGLKTARSGAGLQILRGDASGGFTPAATDPTAVCGNGIREGTELCDDGNTKARDGCTKCAPELKRGITFVGAADFDRDGRNDLVVMDAMGRISLLLGDNSGRFRQVRLLGKGRSKTSAAVADFTGDGIPDVAFIPTGGKRITVLRNDGAAQFTPVFVPTFTRMTGPLLSGDFDRSGSIDLMVAYKGGWTVLPNTASGLGSPTLRVPVPKGLRTLAAADFDEDGSLDVLAVVKNQTLLYRGAGAGGFNGSQTFPGGTLSNPFLIDLDGDKHQDVVDCDTGQTTCRALYGTGTGNFGTAPVVAPVASDYIGPDVRGGGAGDFDHNGVVDLVGVSFLNDEAVVVFQGNNSPLNRRLKLPTGHEPSDLAVLDLNGDGFLDFMAANRNSRDISIFTNLGGGAFAEPARLRLPNVDDMGLDRMRLAVGDINGDGTPDLAAVQSGGVVTPLLNLGGGGLGALASLTTGKAPWGVGLGKLDPDGQLVMATANRDDNTVSVFLSQSGGNFTRTDIASGGLRPSAVAVVDLNGDHKEDLVVANEQVALDTTLGNLVTFLNNGSGGFSTPTFVHVRGRELPRTVCSGDFDGDTVADVAVASALSSDIMVLHGNGDGTWRSDERDFPVGGGGVSAWCLDVDGDGRTDISYGRQLAGDVGVILTAQ